LGEVYVVRLPPPVSDVQAALPLAEQEAKPRIGDAMLLSWHDCIRDFEASQHVSACHQDSTVPGDADNAPGRGATLKLDGGNGRFVFFGCPVDR